MNIDELVKYIVDYCIDNKLNKLYICGNGGSGKTTLSKGIEKYALKYGNVNVISTDDFMVNTELRKNVLSHENEFDFAIENNDSFIYKIVRK